MQNSENCLVVYESIKIYCFEIDKKMLSMFFIHHPFTCMFHPILSIVLQDISLMIVQYPKRVHGPYYYLIQLSMVYLSNKSHGLHSCAFICWYIDISLNENHRRVNKSAQEKI